ncbi:chymotrypsinogen A-like [Paramacrobiotus metropolitanus]|uniref:chymotrypsinogen A-like n=1 Tax=Paramacrobiotus metropolitanus TaxID=2943436 RepID=UPI002445E2E3|nr:chymotrypsinogen A-like [Paramacrobiotus metropolitanus]
MLPISVTSHHLIPLCLLLVFTVSADRYDTESSRVNKRSKWQADRIIMADESGEPIQQTLDDPEAFGDDFGNSEEDPSYRTNLFDREYFATDLQKRNTKAFYPPKTSFVKQKQRPSKWANEVLAARGILSRYQVGQKKEFDFAPKDTYQCGVQKVAPNDWLKGKPTSSGLKDVTKRRIEARHHSWPWQVDIFFYRVENGSAVRVHLCGGTLIDRWHVITAAHCNIIRSQNFALGRPKSYYIRVGQHYRSVDRDTVQTIRVDKWIDHQHYNDSVSEGENPPKFFLYNDIAFLRLDRPVDLSDEVHPVCLDFTDTTPFAIGTTCYATGWSLEEFDYQKWIKGDYSEVLNESKSKIAKDAYCLKHHSGYNADVTLCTKYYPGHYSCHGDSGGPLQCERDGRFYLVGIVSYDVATSCRATGMTYFTKIRGLQNWIEGQLEKSLQELSQTS